VLSLRGADLRRGYLSLGQAIAEQPGAEVRQLSGFGATAQLSLRGSGPEQVAAYVDAVPVQSLDGTPLDLSDVSLGQIEMIEVYRGTTPALLGGQAIGGTVRIASRMPRSPGGEVHVSAGSYGARVAEAVAAGGSEDVRITAGLRYLRSDGDYAYLNDYGTSWDKTDDVVRRRANNALQRLGGSVGARWQASRIWSVDSRYIGSGLRQGLPGLALYEALDAKLDQQRHMAWLAATGMGLAQPGDRLRVLAQGCLSSTEVDDRLGELGYAQHNRQGMRTAGATLTYESAPWGPASLQARTSLQQGQVEGRNLLKGQDAPASTRDVATLALAVPLHWQWAALDLVPSASVDLSRSRRMTEQGVPTVWREITLDEGQLWTGRVGASWHPWQPLRVTAGWTRGLRAPTLIELFGNNGVILGNARLLPESAQTFDAAVTLSGEVSRATATLEVAGFSSRVNDLIQLVTNGQHQAIYENVAQAHLTGVEATGHVRWGRDLHVWAQHSTLVARDESGRDAYQNKPLPMRPRTRWTLRAEGMRDVGCLRLGAWSSLQWQSGYFLDAANLVVVPARTILAAGLRAEHRSSGVYVDVRMDNLLDEQVADLIGYPLPGRTFLASLGWRGWPAQAGTP